LLAPYPIGIKRIAILDGSHTRPRLGADCYTIHGKPLTAKSSIGFINPFLRIACSFQQCADVWLVHEMWRQQPKAALLASLVDQYQ